MMKLGWQRDPHGVVKLYAAHLFARLGGDPEIPSSATALGQFLSCRDQGGTSSCVAQSISGAMRILARAKGFDPGFASVLAIYMASRLRTSRGQPVADVGCFPFAAMESIFDVGVVREEEWPFDQGRVNDELPWDVAQKSDLHRIDAYYRIGGWGISRTDDIAKAIAAGHPVIFGMDVDQAYFDYQGGVYRGLRGQPAGGHMQILWGYESTQDGRVFHGLNSWGEWWGDQGRFMISDSFLGDPGACSDFYAFTIPERI